MNRIFAAPLALLLFACGGDLGPIVDATSARTLSQGKIVGAAHETHAAHAWKGIPFATPPVGPLRWRSPKPPQAWEGVREALVGGNECVQLNMVDPSEVNGNEDCLTLDVYAPRVPLDQVPSGADRLPVMVWIHGGGNSIGSAEVYDASRLAAEGDVVVVVIQYRLGVFGWLSHPALRATATNAEDASGNFGTLDTIRALEWVRDNAASFGGDAGNVTIFGESAGGIDVFALLLSPRAKGLFHRAISESGILYSTTRAEAENFIDDEQPGMTGSSSEFLTGLLVEDGSAADRDAAKGQLAVMSDADIEGMLRGKSPEELLVVFGENPMGGMYFSPNLYRDGHVISDLPPLDALRNAETHNAVPTIVGTNREETKLFSLFTSPDVQRVFGLPVSVTDAEAFNLGAEYGGLLWKAKGADEPATAMRSSGRSDVFGYRFDWDEQGELLWLDLDQMLGASHAIELLFVFGFTDLGRFTDAMYGDIDSAEKLSAETRSYWTQFARTGDPGRGRDGTLTSWEPWGATPESPKYLILDSENDGGLRMSRDTVDAAAVLAKLASDKRFTKTETRCATLKDLAQFNPEITPEMYAAFAGGSCAADPLAPRSPLGG